MNTQELIQRGEKYLLFVFLPQDSIGVFSCPPKWYSSDSKENCIKVYNSVKTDESKGFIYLLSDIPKIEACFQPDMIPDNLCQLLTPMTIQDIDLLLTNIFAKELSLPEI